MRSFLALSFLFAAALAQDITVTNSGLAGSGCAPGGSTITHDGTNRKIKVHAQGLIAEVGPVVPLSESSRNCKLTLGVNIPAGFTVDFETVTAKIAYSAGNEVLLAMNALAQWNGQFVPSTGLARVNGPVWDRQATMAVDLAASPMPGPCGGASTANVGVELRATRYDEVSSGYIDGNVEWDVSYKLKACSPSGGGPTPLTSTGVIGTGCPLGTAEVDVNDGTRKVTVRTDSFRAQAGRGIGISENRKACRVMLGVDIPEGHSFAFDRASSGVSYSADGGVLLSVTSLSYFQGSLEQSQGLSTIPGPTRGSILAQNHLKLTSLGNPDSRLISNTHSARLAALGHVSEMATALSLITSGKAAGKQENPVSIRFVPHDQWLLTHIGSYWKVKDVKNHILARCLSLNFTPPEPPSFSLPPDSQPRSPSPITFAPDPVERPESPILFAVMKPKSPHSEDDESEEEDDFSMNLDIRGKAPKPMFDEQGRAVIGLRMAPSPTPKMSSVGGPSSSSHQLRSQNKSDASSIFNLDPKAVPEIAHLSFTLIRFSTGQLLEDDLTMSDYNINPHELLELHLSISPPSPDHVTATSFLPPTATFPFPLLAAPSQLLQGKSRKKRAQIEALVAPHVTRLVSLPRSVPQAYASPYWEGWIRILRLASRDDEEYLYTGLPAGSGNRKYKPGTPGHSQYGFGLALGDWTTSMPNMISEEKDVDMQLAKNFGMGSVGSGSSGYGHGVPASHSGAQIRTAKSKFEWRERWLIIREGWLFLLKERGDTRPSHAFPLANLVNLRDADQLTDSIENAKRRRPSRPAPARSPPRPPHARSPPRAGHVQSPPRSNTTRSAPTAPSVASSSTAQVEPSTSPPRQRHTSSRSQQGHPLFPDFPNPPATDDSSTHPKLRSEYIDPFAPSNVNRKLFVPKSKEEAEAAGMKIICTKFRQTSSEERKDQPDPFRGYDHDIQGLESTLAMQYSSFGPSMDDGSGVAAAVGGLVSGGFIDPLVERVLYENERDEKEERERGKKWEEEAAKARAKLKEKQSVPHSLQLFGNFEPTKTPSNIAERRPSLPQLNTKTSGSSLFNMTPSASIGSIPFSAIFKESRKKRKEEKVLRAKDKGKAKQRDTREAERLLEDFGAFGMTGGGRRKKGKGAERQVKSDGQIPEETFGDPFAAGSSRSVEPHAGVEIPPHVAAERQSPAESETESQMAEDERNYGEEDASTGDEDENKDNPENGAEELSKASSDTTHDHDTALALQIFEEGTLEEEPGSGSESLALSSPVFARAAATDEDDSDLDSIPSRRRRYIYNTTDTRRSFTTSNLQLPTVPEPPPSTTDQPSTSSQANEVSVGSQSDPDQADEDRTKVTPTKAKIPKANPTSPRSSAASHKSGTASIATQSTVTQRKVLAGAKAKNLGSKGQWIIMDVGSDAAYHSLLRVLHRTIEEPLLSSFLQSLQSLFTATPAATPVAATNEQMFPPPSSSQANNPSPSSSVRARSRSDPAQTLLQPPGSATAATFRDDTSPTLATPRPYESSALARTRKMLGTVPYPEWRLRTVNRARRASMGVIGQPLEALSMTMGHHPDGEFLRFDPTLVDQASIDPFVTKVPQSDRDSEGTGDDADDVHAEQGFFGLDHDDYEKNGSDMEWQGWTADISRQVRVAKEAISKQSIPDQTSSPTISEFSSEDEPSDDEQVEFDMLPTSPAEERLLAVKRRFAMEPVGVVTSPTTSTELPSFVADVPGPKAKHHHNDEHRYHHLHKREMNTACMLVSRSLSNASSMDSVRRHPSTSSHAGHSTVPSAHDAPPASPPFEVATSSPSPLSQTFPATAPTHALKHSKSFKGDLQITSELWPTPHVARQPSMPSLGSSVRTMEQVFTLEPTENRVAIRQLTASDELSSGPSSRASPVIPSSVSPPYTPSPGSVSSPSSSNLHKQPSSNFQRQQSLHSSAAQEGSSSSQGPPPSPGTSPKSPRPRLTVATSPTSPQSHTGHLELRSPTRLTHLGLQPASVTSPQSTSQLGPESVASPKKKKSGAFERFVRGL